VDGKQSLGRRAVLQANAGQRAEALRLDEDLTFLAFLGADLATEVVIGAQKPFAVPAVRRTSSSIRATASRQCAASLASPRCREMAANSRPLSANNAAMKTDSATLPSLLVVVWKDWPGVSEKQFRLRQSFQSARPMSGRPCGPRRSSVYWNARCKCS